jgi:hypothetical protein
MHALPIHPTTGLRAIFVSERTGRIYWPILGGEESADAAAQAAARAEADAQAASEAAAAAENAERGYPLKTSPSDMTTDQQVAYYKAMARKHEDRAKGMDSDELKQLRARAKRADELERQNMDVQERAVAEARDTARQEAETAATAKYAPRLAETAFRVAIGTRKSQEDVDEFIADLNLPRFLTDEGQVDTAKVLARVEHSWTRRHPTRVRKRHQRNSLGIRVCLSRPGPVGRDAPQESQLTPNPVSSRRWLDLPPNPVKGDSDGPLHRQ